MRNRNEQTGMVYRGACDLVHIADGKRAEFGEELARELDAMMRNAAIESGAITPAQAWDAGALKLCPGCYMVALFNAAVALAKDNGQSMSELGRSMSAAFAELAIGGPDRIESIAVRLDSEPDSILAAGRMFEAMAGETMQ